MPEEQLEIKIVVTNQMDSTDQKNILEKLHESLKLYIKLGELYNLEVNASVFNDEFVNRLKDFEFNVLPTNFTNYQSADCILNYLLKFFDLGTTFSILPENVYKTRIILRKLYCKYFKLDDQYIDQSIISLTNSEFARPFTLPELFEEYNKLYKNCITPDNTLDSSEMESEVSEQVITDRSDSPNDLGPAESISSIEYPPIFLNTNNSINIDKTKIIISSANISNCLKKLCHVKCKQDYTKTIDERKLHLDEDLFLFFLHEYVLPNWTMEKIHKTLLFYPDHNSSLLDNNIGFNIKKHLYDSMNFPFNFPQEFCKKDLLVIPVNYKSNWICFILKNPLNLFKKSVQ